MTEELRKRLEEAAKEYSMENSNGWEISALARGFLAGAEYGYKEAIIQAKEWLKGHLPTPDWYASLDEFISCFEADMNKLWEGEK